MRLYFKKSALSILLLFILAAPEASAWRSWQFTHHELVVIHSALGRDFKNWFIPLFSVKRPDGVVKLAKSFLNNETMDDATKRAFFAYTKPIRNPLARLVVLAKAFPLFFYTKDAHSQRTLLNFFTSYRSSPRALSIHLDVALPLIEKLFTSQMDDFDKFEVMMALLSNPRSLRELPTYVEVLVEHAPKLLDRVEDGVDHKLIMVALAQSARSFDDIEIFMNMLDAQISSLKSEGMTSFDEAYLMAALIRSPRNTDQTVRFVQALCKHVRKLKMKNMSPFAQVKLIEAFIDSPLAAIEIEEYTDEIKSHAGKLFTRQMTDFEGVKVIKLLLDHVKSPDEMEQFVFDVLAQMNNDGVLEMTNPDDQLQKMAEFMKS